MGVSQDVQEAAQAIITAPAASLGDALNGFIRQFVGWPFTNAPGFVVDVEGNRTETFACVVHTTPAIKDGPNAGGLAADGVAAVIDAIDNLELGGLRESYARIAQARRLTKSPAPNIKGATPTTTITLGVILAQRSELPLETLAKELDGLNAGTPGRERPDMLVVAPTGVVNYGVQFPGEGVTGDFLPPGEGALEAFTPSMYIVMVMRPSGALSLNKMLAFVIAHLEIFSPAARVPRWLEVLEGVTPNVVTLWGYQYNLAGELVPVPERFYNDRYLAPLPVRLEDQQGKLLGMLRFLPWQDGAAIRLEESKLPLEGLLVFLGRDALKRGGIIKRNDSQISYVLPITSQDFGRFLSKLQQQSNMVVRPMQPDWTVQKVADEGSSSPLMARLMIGLLRLRDNVFDAANRDDFDKPYDIVLKDLFSARDVRHHLAKVWEEHARKVAAGEIARVVGRTIHVDESVDRELGQEAESFINAVARAVKKGMQDVALVLGVNIGFLFQKQAPFEKGLEALKAVDPDLAAYLGQARTAWSEMLQDARNAIEHEGWKLPRVAYKNADGGVHAVEPEIRGMKATVFSTFIFDRLECFVEEVTSHLLKRRLPALTGLAEVPRVERPEMMPERFRLTLAKGGMPLWVIAYHASPFEET